MEKKMGIGVGILIIKEGKILLGKRNDDAQKADSLMNGEGTWTMPGGKLDFGSSFEEAAIRETIEETSIEIKKLEVLCVNNDISDKAHFVTIGLLATEYEGEPKVMEPNEITEWRWFDMNNLPPKLYFPSSKVIRNYREGKFYIKDNNGILN